MKKGNRALCIYVAILLSLITTDFRISLETKWREDEAKNIDLRIISVEVAIETIKVEGTYITYNNKDKFKKVDVLV